MKLHEFCLNALEELGDDRAIRAPIGRVDEVLVVERHERLGARLSWVLQRGHDFKLFIYRCETVRLNDVNARSRTLECRTAQLVKALSGTACGHSRVTAGLAMNVSQQVPG